MALARNSLQLRGGCGSRPSETPTRSGGRGEPTGSVNRAGNCGARTWAPVIRALPDHVTATALDLPAESDLDELVDQVAGQVAPGSVVVGHSLGGVVAMHLAERHPSLLAGLVLVTAPVGAEDPESAAARADRAAGLSPEA
ncbi:alpha/beta fold hydrolase [Dietzia cercidiphylli]|uniref:alpha/beta fold hydrolase n=1 Tax=Dietzia cercidiphylli TaxID=498199 RepID=UPI003F7D43E4